VVVDPRKVTQKKPEPVKADEPQDLSEESNSMQN
jgi:hypothetical protein